MTQFVLYGGKGGVGKTTLAAASGLRSARDGQRTLIVSTDPAHSVGDAFDVALDGSPTRVVDAQDLYAVEVDPRERFEKRYGGTFEDVLADVESLGVDLDRADVEAVTDRGLVPGADEVAVVDLFAEYDDHPDWDVVVFDTAPTGHTLRLLTLPDVMNSTVGTMLSVKNQLSSVTSTVKQFIGEEDAEPSSSYSEQLAQLETVMADVAERLQNGDRSTFRVVTLPERMAIAETERLLARLRELDVSVDRVFANKVLENASEDCPTCWPRYQEQRTLLSEAEATFDVPVQRVPLRPDATGVDRVRAVADDLPKL